MKLRTFRDYIDDSGRNVITEWLHDLPMEARLEINTRIQYLEVSDQLRRPDAAMLSGKCDGLFELRIRYKGIQYRPLACHGPARAQVTLLVGAIKKGNRFEPLSACDTAQKRKARIHEPGRTDEHSFAEPPATS